MKNPDKPTHQDALQRAKTPERAFACESSSTPLGIDPGDFGSNLSREEKALIWVANSSETLKHAGWVKKAFWHGYTWSHELCGPALYKISDALKINESLEKR